MDFMKFISYTNDLWWRRGGSAAAGGVISGGSGGLELGLEGVRAPAQTLCCTWRTAQSPQHPYAAAARCLSAAIESSFHSSF